MKFKYLHSLLLTIFASGAALAQGQYNLPAEIKDGNILHCFDWKMADIKSELPIIAEAGFTAVQISPVQRNINANAIWYDVYRPYDFKFIGSNGLGQAADLQALCAEAEKYGIKVIVDVVFNHVDSKGYHDSWWDSNGRVRSTNSYINYGNRYSITHDKLGDYCEVNSEDADVTARAKAYIEELKGFGVKGIRFDAAKHVGLPSEGTNFWKEVTSVPGLFYYGEILGTPGGSNANALMKEYTDYMSVTDESYSNSARGGSGVPTSEGNWTGKGIDGSKLVYWGESHDTFSNTPEYGGVTNSLPQNLIDKAYAILACRNTGVGLYFSRPNTTSTGQIRVGQKGSTHFTSREVAEVNKFKNEMVGKADSYSYSSKAGSVTRQNGGAVIVAKTAYAEVEVPNGKGYCPAGIYYDRVSGNTFTVTETTITGKVGRTGIAVIYGDFAPDDDFEIDEGTADEGGQVYIYTTNPNGWADVYVYLYTRDGATFTNGNWPGAKMTKNGELWEYAVPETLRTNTSVIFNNGNGGGTNQYPSHTDSQTYDGYLLDGKSMINDGTGVSNWNEYVPAGIGDIFDDEEFDSDKAIWYNLQGVRVSNPEKGLYIVVSPNGKTKKMLVP